MKKIIKLTEQDLHNIVKEVVESVYDEYGYPKEWYNMKIYHRAGMHTRLNLKELIASICKNGLTTSTSTDGDGIGKCIWFATDFDSYGKNGQFVVSMRLTPEKMQKYHIDVEGNIAYAYRDIPFSELTIEKMPMCYTTCMGGVYLINFNWRRLTDSYFDFFKKAANNNKNYEFIVYLDAWDYFGEPYDLDIIKSMDNVKIETIMS